VFEFQHGELQILDPLLCPNMGVMEDFEESAQEPTVRCNIQPAAQPKEIIDFQLNDSNFSNQSPVATYDSLSAFPHEPLPSTSASSRLIFDVDLYCFVKLVLSL